MIAFWRGSLSHGFPIALLSRRSACVSLRWRHGQLLHSRHGFASLVPQARERCWRWTFWSHSVAYVGSWRLNRIQCLASSTVPWSDGGHDCQYLLVYASLTEMSWLWCRLVTVDCLCATVAYLNFDISVWLMANEMLRSLLDDFGFECWSHCHFSS